MMPSTGNILDVADGAGAIKALVESVGDEGVSGSTEGRADEHKSDGQGEDKGRSNRVNDSEVTVRHTGRDCDCAKGMQIPNPKHYQLQVPTSGYQGPSADSQFPTDDRYAAVAHQHGDDDSCHSNVHPKAAETEARMSRVPPELKLRAVFYGMAFGAILWGALGLIVWMVR